MKTAMTLKEKRPMAAMKTTMKTLTATIKAATTTVTIQSLLPIKIKISLMMKQTKQVIRKQMKIAKTKTRAINYLHLHQPLKIFHKEMHGFKMPDVHH